VKKMQGRKSQEDEQMGEIKKLLLLNKAVEAAAFAAAMTRDEWRNLSRTAEKLGTRPEDPQEENPHTADVRAVSFIFSATPMRETVATSLNRIREHEENIANYAAEAGGSERMLQYCQAMETVAGEFKSTLVVDPDLKSGKPCIRGMRITAFDILELLAEGNKPEQILREQTDLKRSDIDDCMWFGLKLAEAIGENA
jgi:uncharacterized protein (DUF433 family)